MITIQSSQQPHHNFGLPPGYPIPVSNMFQQQPQPYGYNLQNNGYFNPIGGYGYYNPYMMENMIKQQEAKRNELQRQQTDLLKTFSRIASKGKFTESEIEERVKIYDPVTYVQDPAYIKREKVVRFHTSNFIDVETLPSERVARMNVEFNRVAKIYEGMNAIEALKEMGYQNYLMKQEAERFKTKNVGNMYDGDKFKQLLNLHSNSGNGYFDTTFKPITLDDLSIPLPTSSLDKQREERKRRFLELSIGGRV